MTIRTLVLLGTVSVVNTGCGSNPEAPPSFDPGAVQTIEPNQANRLPANRKGIQAPLPPGATGTPTDPVGKLGG